MLMPSTMKNGKSGIGINGGNTASGGVGSTGQNTVTHVG